MSRLEWLWLSIRNEQKCVIICLCLRPVSRAAGHLRLSPSAGAHCCQISWLLPVCFSGSLISQEEKRTSTSERSPAGSQDRIKWSPLLDRELLAHLRKAAPLRQDDYFWQCLSQEGTFTDLMGPGPLYTAFCMAPCHDFHSVEGEKKMSRGCCLKWISNKSVVFKVILNAADIFPTVTSL